MERDFGRAERARASSFPPPAPKSRRAFVAARHGDRTWVADLPEGKPCVVGRSANAVVRADDPALAERHAILAWDGDVLRVEPGPERPPCHLNGKRFEGSTELRLGDELVFGPLQLVVGIAMSPDATNRRVLTHHEFRERVWEEVARATRSRRPTALAMVKLRTGDGRHVAATALATFRAGDVVGNYAEDELELLLPDTPRAAAVMVAERLLERAEVRGARVGVAVFPEDGDGPERLLRAARTKLAEADGAPRAGSGLAAAEPEAHSPLTQALVQRLRTLAMDDAPVVLTGEPSVGKSVFARLLHDEGPRSSGPFVRVLCTAPERGAGAGRRGGPGGRKLLGDQNAFEAARGGTLLVDEVSELGREDQIVLREALEGQHGDVRLVLTTPRDLGALAERSAFDPALYARLAQAETLDVPALRERPEDIIPLAERFARESNGGEPVHLSPGALARLRSYPWFGNVLELRNAMERAVRVAKGEILAEHLPSEVLPASSSEGKLREHVDSVERDAIVRALADANHNQTHAARRLGLSRRALIYKMEKYGLKRPPGASSRTRAKK